MQEIFEDTINSLWLNRKYCKFSCLPENSKEFGNSRIKDEKPGSLLLIFINTFQFSYFHFYDYELKEHFLKSMVSSTSVYLQCLKQKLMLILNAILGVITGSIIG